VKRLYSINHETCAELSTSKSQIATVPTKISEMQLTALNTQTYSMPVSRNAIKPPLFNQELFTPKLQKSLSASVPYAVYVFFRIYDFTFSTSPDYQRFVIAKT
jgi:hypothetical protein